MPYVGHLLHVIGQSFHQFHHSSTANYGNPTAGCVILEHYDIVAVRFRESKQRPFPFYRILIGLKLCTCIDLELAETKECALLLSFRTSPAFDRTYCNINVPATDLYRSLSLPLPPPPPPPPPEKRPIHEFIQGRYFSSV